MSISPEDVTSIVSIAGGGGTVVTLLAFYFRKIIANTKNLESNAQTIDSMNAASTTIYKNITIEVDRLSSLNAKLSEEVLELRQQVSNLIQELSAMRIANDKLIDELNTVNARCKTGNSDGMTERKVNRRQSDKVINNFITSSAEISKNSNLKDLREKPKKD